MPCPGAPYVPDGSDNDTDTYKMTMTDIHRDNLEPERVMETFCSPSPRLHNNGNQLRYWMTKLISWTIFRGLENSRFPFVG